MCERVENLSGTGGHFQTLGIHPSGGLTHIMLETAQFGALTCARVVSMVKRTVKALRTENEPTITKESHVADNSDPRT